MDAGSPSENAIIQKGRAAIILDHRSALGSMHGASLAAVVTFCSSLAAQTAAPLPEQKAQELSTHQLELRGVQDTLDQSAEQGRKIETEIESIKTDRAKLTEALVETTQRVSALEDKIGETEKRLDTMTGSEDAIRHSLEGRRAVIAEVLAALQRMGRRPPPALFVAPEDMLQAIRTSMLLGAVVPQMRAETESLAADLTDLLAVRKSIAAERDQLAHDMANIRADRQRLAALIEARQTALSAAEQALGAERERAAELAKHASSLKDLIARMETEVTAAARGAEAARKADEARKAS
ncbi:MAG TPA: hypothetical protein VEQ35_08505, partial [Beijerinckia sp.]|nr:hypothetical protein [Beijerinckia sp.]